VPAPHRAIAAGVRLKNRPHDAGYGHLAGGEHRDRGSAEHPDQGAIEDARASQNAGGLNEPPTRDPQPPDYGRVGPESAPSGVISKSQIRSPPGSHTSDVVHADHRVRRQHRGSRPYPLRAERQRQLHGFGAGLHPSGLGHVQRHQEHSSHDLRWQDDLSRPQSRGRHRTKGVSRRLSEPTSVDRSILLVSGARQDPPNGHQAGREHPAGASVGTHPPAEAERAENPDDGMPSLPAGLRPGA